MAFWDDWQKNKNPITWSEGFQHGYKKIPKSSTPSSEELSLAKANKKLVGKEKLDKNMQNTVQKVVENMIKEGNTSGRFDKNKPRDLLKFNQKFIDKSSNTGKAAFKYPYTYAMPASKPTPGREYMYVTINADGSKVTSYGSSPDPKDATHLGSKALTTKPEFKPKVDSKAKPTVSSAVKETTKSTDGSEAFIKGVARSAKKISNGKDIDPTAEGSLHRMVSKGLPNEAPHIGKDGIRLRRYHFEQDAEREYKRLGKPSFNKLDKPSPYNNNNNNNNIPPKVPQNSNAYYKQLSSLVKGGINGVIANLGTLGSMPLPGDPKENRDRLRVEFGQDELSNIDTVVKMNPQGTMYLDPKLGIQNTEVVEDYEGGRYYRNAQTGQFEPLDYNPRYSTYVPLPRVKKTHLIDGVFPIPAINDYLGGALSMPMSTTPLPIPPMHYNSDANKPLPPISTDEGEIPSGTVEVGPDTEKPVDKPTVASVVKPKKVANTPAQPMAKPLRRAPKPKPYVEQPAVDNTPVTPEVPISNVSAPTLSSVVPQAVRPNGGFDNYRRQSVLSALRAAGGISPAEAVQRGIIPWEALNYV